MAGTIICYGDSNTYGYDACSFLGGRYPDTVRWPELLAKQSGWTVINYGQNGRRIPEFFTEMAEVTGRLSVWGQQESPIYLWIMLGTNDLLLEPRRTGEETTKRMEKLLRHLLEQEEIATGQIQLRLIGPARLGRGMWVESRELVAESEKLGALYGGLAESLGIAYSDAGAWELPLVYDGVHFSEEAHQEFARRMEEMLPKQEA